MEQMAWLCMGDFNKILTNVEKFGAANKPISQMESFREALYDCELTDLGYKRSMYTWSNKREGGEFTKERLDRVLGNGDMQMSYSSCLVQVLHVMHFDHNPLFILCECEDEMQRRLVKIFRYEALWSKKQECKELIKRVWGASITGCNTMSSLKLGLAHCRNQLTHWSKAVRGDHKKQLSLKRDMIQELQNISHGDFNETIKGLQAEVDVILEDEDFKWTQRAKEKWL
ncbi:uncharacterized protein LOC118347976 [Juglans regia]|uniref:Uncharacterized protein LOC118347976 n=1 Tax=Juglans regia TaxID=51240 RepID=A0A6P9EAX7_JUGRE|nr:uncharacterized protein LOC118347976 [Juglans regia]